MGSCSALTLVLGRHKPHFNPLVVAPPAAGGNYAQFRDPTTAWRQDGLWYTAIGVQANCIGGASMYSSPDMRNWTYVGQLASQLGINATAGLQCSAPPVLQPGNGACDQMGADCHTWVCTLAGTSACSVFSRSSPRMIVQATPSSAKAEMPVLVVMLTAAQLLNRSGCDGIQIPCRSAQTTSAWTTE